MRCTTRCSPADSPRTTRRCTTPWSRSPKEWNASGRWPGHRSAGVSATLRWPQLLFWRPVPGFEPSAATFATSVESLARVRAELTEAARRRQLTRHADSDEAVRLLTVVISGLFTRQAANQPDVAYDEGLFSQLTDDAIEMFLARYQTRRR